MLKRARPSAFVFWMLLTLVAAAAPGAVCAQEAPPETPSVATAAAPEPPPVRDTARAAAPADRVADARPFRPTRFWLGVGGFVAADVPVMIGLSQIWYEDDPVAFSFFSDRMRERFGSEFDHGWLDDWHEWKQQDKLGHFFVAWQLARVFGAYGRWSGLSDRQAGLFGGVMSGAFQTQIEVFDGFDRSHGFSRTDLLANVVGGAIGGLKVAYPERLGWFTAKYSYHPSPYYGTTHTGPSGAGVGSFVGNAINDYDGISYWLVVRPEELLSERYAERWPDWLGLAVGHSGTGLRFPKDGIEGRHQRQLFLAPDIDFLRPEVLRAWDVPQPLRAVANVLSFLRLPAPALQLTPEVRWYWVYY